MKKLFTIMIAFMMSLSLCACSTSNEQSSESKFTPGTYTGVGQGNNSTITLEVTVDENSIVSIEIGENQETPGMCDVAMERIPEAVIEGQTLAVDTVAGATGTSRGVIEAITAALKEAGANIDALSVKESTSTETEEVELSTDVIVVGAGGAGLTAAITAHQAGANVIVLEKMPKTGGNSIMASGSFNVADQERDLAYPLEEQVIGMIRGLVSEEPVNDFHKELMETVAEQLDEHLASENADKLFDSSELHMLQTLRGGDFKGHPDLIRTLCSNGLETIDWMESLGAVCEPKVGNVPGSLYQRSASYGRGQLGAPIFKTFQDYLDANEGNGITLMLDTCADELIVEEGKVCGVTATAVDGSSHYTISSAKNVVLATGGFAANVDMRQKYDTIWGNLDETIGTSNHPGATGDGLVMAEKVGAQLIDLGDIQCLCYGDPSTGGTEGLAIQASEDCIFVNQEGERFVSEYERRDVMAAALLEQTNAIMYIVMDSKSYPTLETKTPFATTMQYELETEGCFMGETLEELAEKINVPADALIATVEKYNAGVDAGKDEFNKAKMHKIEEGPFFANPRVFTVHHTMGGISINDQCEVLTADGTAIPGLYAAGEVTGGIHGTNRLGGNAITDFFVFGRIAGKNAAK